MSVDIIHFPLCCTVVQGKHTDLLNRTDTAALSLSLACILPFIQPHLRFLFHECINIESQAFHMSEIMNV